MSDLPTLPAAMLTEEQRNELLELGPAQREWLNQTGELPTWEPDCGEELSPTLIYREKPKPKMVRVCLAAHTIRVGDILRNYTETEEMVLRKTGDGNMVETITRTYTMRELQECNMFYYDDDGDDWLPCCRDIPTKEKE